MVFLKSKIINIKIYDALYVQYDGLGRRLLERIWAGWRGRGFDYYAFSLDNTGFSHRPSLETFK